VSDAIKDVIPFVNPAFTLSYWCSISLIYYVKKKKQFLRNVRNLILITIVVFLYIIINWSKLLLRQIYWIGKKVLTEI
jgi:hypothetical protein